MAGKEQLGPYLLSWPNGVFPLGQDTLELGRFATVRNGWTVCDLGTGSGALLLLLAGRSTNLSLYGIDLDPLAVCTAQKNLTANHLSGHILHEDLVCCTLPPGQFDLVISNPPYFSPSRGKSGGAARCEEQCTLSQLCTTAARLTRNGGRFALCHRPERLAEIFSALQKTGFEPKRLKLLSHSPNHPPFCVLIESVRQGRPGLEFVL